MVDLGPTDPGDPRAVAARHQRPTWTRTYTYQQRQHTTFEILLRRKARTPRYVVRVAENHAGHPFVRTERWDPERGSGPNLKHVEIPDLPRKILAPMAVFVFAVSAIIMIVVPFPFNSILGMYWSFSLAWRMFYKVERARFARQLGERIELPPLLSNKELDARVFTLANPDEDRTFDEPAPIPMPQGLRDPAWSRWFDRLEELPDQEYRVGQTAYKIKQNSGFANGPDHPLCRLVEEIRDNAAFYAERVTIRQYFGDRSMSVKIDREDHPTLRPLFEDLGREVLGPERVAELDDRRRAAAHGEPMLDRRFAARTDCADGHVGGHPILSTFIDSNGNKRVRRSCIWCVSTWSELV